MSAAHVEAHEIAIVEHVFGAEGEPAALARQLVACEVCLAYAVGLVDQLAGLHDLARSRLAEASPPVLASLQRIDLLLDDVMVLLATDPGGGGGEHAEKVEHGGRRAIPVGDE